MFRHISGYQEVSDEAANQAIQLDGSELVIEATANVHAEISRILATWEASGLGQVCTEARLITSTEQFFERMGVDFDVLAGFTVVDEPELPKQSQRNRPELKPKNNLPDQPTPALPR
ncbi:MAG: hypothetical protein U1D30_23255 [Planctomycetota bacterium]